MRREFKNYIMVKCSTAGDSGVIDHWTS